MTIRKGEEWGRAVDRPAALLVASGDAELAALLVAGVGPVGVASGDLHRTLGAPDLGDRRVVRALSVDLLEVSLDDGSTHRAVAHVVARSPWWRGGWWRGPVLAVMNAEFHGRWDVAPRGHPNDGRAEAQLASAAMTVRDRLAARSRLRHGGHVPHPEVTTGSVRAGTWSFDAPLVVRADGRVVGRSRHVAVEVLADAATIYA